MGRTVDKSQPASSSIPSVPHVHPVIRLEPAEPIPAIYQRARVVFAACAVAGVAKVIERVWKYDSDQFYEGSPKLDTVLIAVMVLAVVSQTFVHIRYRDQ